MQCLKRLLSLSVHVAGWLQLKWGLPDETGGEEIMSYTLQMQPAPPGCEAVPDAQVGHKHEQRRWWIRAQSPQPLLQRTAAEHICVVYEDVGLALQSKPGKRKQLTVRVYKMFCACCMQGFYEVYTGEERSWKVGKLPPGSRYMFRIKVGRGSFAQHCAPHPCLESASP
jgi:hypothetical protein